MKKIVGLLFLFCGVAPLGQNPSVVPVSTPPTNCYQLPLFSYQAGSALYIPGPGNTCAVLTGNATPGPYLPLAGGTMTGTVTFDDGGTWSSSGIATSQQVFAATANFYNWLFQGSASTSGVALGYDNSGVTVGSAANYGWSATGASAGPDTTMTRVSAGVVELGTLSNAAAGTLDLAVVQQSTLLTTSTLPSCAAGTLLQRNAVSDATVATPGSAYVGSGHYSIAVQCIYNSATTTYLWIID